MSGFGGGVASLIMKSAGGGEIITDNLVLHLDAGNTSSYSGSGTTWNDLSNGMSGTPNNATLTNGPTFDSGNGGSIVFDGNNDRVDASSFFNSNDNFTFSVWLNSDTFTGTNGYTIISNHTHSAAFQLAYKNGTGVVINKSWVGPNVGTFSSSTLSTGTWYNLTITRQMTSYPTKTYTLYINGSFTSSFTSSVTYDRYPKCIGANLNTTELWDGKIAKVFAYSTNLTASEVLQNYNATKARFGFGDIVTNNLVLHLDAGDSSSYSGSGTTWTDLTGNGNNGTLVNGVSYSSSDGGYLSFDGSNDRVDFSTYVQPAYTSSTSFTWLIWVYPTSYSNNDVIMGNRVISGSNVWTKLTPTRFEWKYPNHLDNSTDVTQNQWQNICITKNGSSFTYYKNGSSIDTMTSTASKDSHPFHLGGDASYNEFAQCRISIVAVYDVALTASEVLQNYNATKSNYV